MMNNIAVAASVALELTRLISKATRHDRDISDEELDEIFAEAEQARSDWYSYDSEPVDGGEPYDGYDEDYEA
jgi:hypothetical protein